MSNYVVPDANTIITLAKMDKWSQIGFADDPTGGQYYLNQLLSPNSTLVITISVLAEVTAQYGNLKASDVGIISDWFSQIQANKIGGNSVLLYQDTQQPSKGAGERSIEEFIQSQSPGIFGNIFGNIFGFGSNNVQIYNDDVKSRAFRDLTQALATNGVPGSVNSTTGFLSQLVRNGSISVDQGADSVATALSVGRSLLKDPSLDLFLSAQPTNVSLTPFTSAIRSR